MTVRKKKRRREIKDNHNRREMEMEINKATQGTYKSNENAMQKVLWQIGSRSEKRQNMIKAKKAGKLMAEQVGRRQDKVGRSRTRHRRKQNKSEQSWS